MATFVGKRFGPYFVEAQIGEGGMATVFRARRQDLDHEVALKIIHPDLANSDLFLKRFQREAETVSTLSHPHIVKIIEHGQHKRTFFLAMELLTQGSLEQLIRQGPVPLETTAQYLTQIASALEYAHGQGIIHRDLKPENVMLDAQGRAVLTDFGLAKFVTEAISRTILTQSGAQIGTPAYMAPEQWKGEAADVRSDVYGLGLLLYEMLTGSMAFKADNGYDLMHKHLYMPPPSLRKERPDLPLALEGVIRRALAKDRIERYQSMAELRQSFGEALEPGIRATSVDFKPGQLGHADEYAATFLVSSAQVAAQEAQAIANLHTEQKTVRAVTPTRQSRLIGLLPQDVASRYVGRAKQVADVTNLLTEKTRLISIYGRGGVGKTALACKALSNVLSGEQGVEGIVCLSAGSTGISLEQILTSFGQLLGGNDKILLDYLAKDNDTLAVRKVAILLEKLAGGHYILLLDNLESLQDSSTGALVDPDLQALFDVALEQGSGLRLLITSREPLTLQRTLKTWERLVPLDAGLPTEEAIALLRACDPDGAANLSDAAPELLRALADKAGGFPRALEATAGLLLEDPLLSPEALLQDVNLLSGEISTLIVQKAIARLSPDALRIMEVLALLERPVTQNALAYLLAPYLDTSLLRTQLARLVSSYFASFNKVTLQFTLHAIDRAYCYQLIPPGSVGDWTQPVPLYTRSALHHRAAEFYRLQRKPQAEWRVLDDLAPQISELEHRLAAQDYDEAARLLLLVDRDYLWEWGQQHQLSAWYKRLLGHLTDPRLAHHCLRRYAWTLFRPDLDEASALFEQQLQEARHSGDRQREADAIDDLAQTRRARNDNIAGFQGHQEALQIYREIGDRRGQAEALGGMGASLTQTFAGQAIGYFEEALSLQREFNNLYSVSFLLGSLGSAYASIGQRPRALACFEEGLALARALNSLTSLCFWLTMLGGIYSHWGQYETAFKYLGEALTIASELSGGQASFVLSLATGRSGLARAFSGDYPAALNLLRPLLSKVGTSAGAIVIRGSVAAILLRMGEIQEGYGLIQALLSAPFPPGQQAGIAVLTARAGDYDKAVGLFKSVVEKTAAPGIGYEPLYARGLALAGLGLLTGDAAMLPAAIEAYRQALAIADLPGYLRWHLGILDALMQFANGEMLAPVRAVLVSEATPRNG